MWGEVGAISGKGATSGLQIPYIARVPHSLARSSSHSQSSLVVLAAGVPDPFGIAVVYGWRWSGKGRGGTWRVSHHDRILTECWRRSARGHNLSTCSIARSLIPDG